MGIGQKLGALALRQLAGGAAEAVGFEAGKTATVAVVDFLVERFNPYSSTFHVDLQNLDASIFLPFREDQ